MSRRRICLLVFVVFPFLHCLAQQSCGAAAVGDLNGDGKPDIVVGNGELNNVGVFLNAGGGSFGAGTFFATPTPADFVCLADFNSDGHLDILVHSLDLSGTVGPSLHILFGDGKGGFSAPVSISTPGMVDAASSVVADFNGDGIPDIAYPALGSDPAGPGAAVTILLGNGLGGFLAPRTTQLVLDAFLCCHASVVAQFQVLDANKDGKLDLLVEVTPIRSIFPLGVLALGDGQGGFKTEPLQIFPPSNFATVTANHPPLGAADFNGDGNLDFLFSDTTTVLFGNGQGGFLYENASVSLNPTFLNIAFSAFPDIDGDQTADIITTGGYLPGNGHGGVGDVVPITFPAGTLVAVADLNGDSKPDFVFRQNGSTKISVLLNNLTAPVIIHSSTATSLLASAATTSVGTTVILLGKVTSSGGIPTGNVTFTDGTNNIGAAPVNVYGVAALTTSFTTGGLHSLTASFAGGTDASINTTFGNSSSGPITILVNNSQPSAQAPIIGITSLPNPAREKNQVQFSNTVSSTSGAPSGFVIYMADGQVIDRANAGSTLLAAFAPGLHNIQATYGGDATFPPVISSILVEDVRALTAVRAPSVTQVSAVSATNGSAKGFNMTATVNGGSNPASGYVNFRVDGAVAASATPGTPVFLAVGPGTYTVSADYPGDATLLPSSASTTIAITAAPPPPPDYAVAASPQSATINAGQTATFTLTVTPSGGFNSSVSFACGTLPAGASCAFTPPSVTPNGSPVSTTLTISTTAPHTASLSTPRSRPGFYGWPIATAIFGLMLTARKRSKTAAMAGISLVVCAVLLLAGCGGGGGGSTSGGPVVGTPSGTTQIMVTASSSSTHSTPITLTVN